jgi:hypothetical protein
MSTTPETKPLPAWLVMTDEGVNITLKYKATVNDITVDKLFMRAPCIRDNRKAQTVANGDRELHEFHLFASLTDCPVKDIEGFKERDYRRLQEGYFRLVEETEL